uniref:uncharacterized protein LOC101243222 isoform X4 n=1 Tax=Ciona intestinalis TaxID=7719 RepID=UPI00089DD5F0|nr:uncharacterized protein LOC101243222 isoform X4 [Ciona intestinalis]|eukprot:XP_004225489.3 uncharacterized protein LOC101243222 isoform X4 [Ciona intestinalis]
MLLKALAVFSLLLSLGSCDHPGVRVKGDSALYNFVKDLIVSYVESNARLNFSDVQHDYNVGSDTYTYALTNITVSSIGIGAAGLHGISPNFVSFYSKTLTLNLQGTYTVSSANSLVSTGSLSVTFGSINMAEWVRLNNVNGVFVASTVLCNVQPTGQPIINAITPTLSASHTSNLKTMIASDLKQAIPSVVCNGTDAFLIGNVNRFIATSIAAGLPLSTTISVDISAYGPPSVTYGSLQIGLNGKCYPVNDPGVNYTFQRTPLPNFTNSNGMLKMMVGEYATNTLLHSMYDNGLLALSPRQILITLGTSVNTAILSIFIPGFLNYGTKPMLFMLSVLNPPNVTIAESDVAIAGILELTMLVNNTGTLEAALVIDADSILHGTASASGTTVHAQITSVEYTLSIQRSTVGSVNLPGFKALLNIVVQNQLIPTLNSVIFTGFEIPPIYGLRYTNLEISMLQGAMEISGNVEGAFEN